MYICKKANLVVDRRDIFLKHIGQTSELPLMLEVDRAEGIHIYDTNGNRYYDFNSGINVSSLGHRHPKVVKAIEEQLGKHLHTMVYGEHVQEVQLAFAEKLLSNLPEHYQSIYYLLSGSEAIELAMKLARRYTGRTEIISCSGAYHGSTTGAESLRSDYEFSRSFFPTMPDIRHIKFNELDELQKVSNKTAAVICEPVQAESGVIVPKDGYLQKLQDRCRETGAMFILDEIQTGFGRTGSLFAFQKYKVEPDIFCIGKSMGAGMPLSGVVSSKEILNVLTDHPSLGHITTFGGHPVSCAAAYAGLKVLLDSDLISKVLEKERLIHEVLQHPIINQIRSSGLMMAVELRKRKYLKHVVSKAFENGVLIDFFLFNRASFRMAPPLIYTEDQIKEVLEKIIDAMDYAQSVYEK